MRWVLPALKVLGTGLLILGCFYGGLAGLFFTLLSVKVWEKVVGIALILICPSILPFLWLKKRKIYGIAWGSVFAAALVTFSVSFGIDAYKKSITVDVTPNINVQEYLPFDENSKIVKYDSKTLKLTDHLPIIDGATAAFPVYSAFVHAVYPETTTLNDGVFEYNNTVYGYRQLAHKKTDLFLGAAPSKEQREAAEELGTVFEYTQIGSEAFVFFVHKDNPIDSLTVEQIKGIYSGKITNWKELGGADEEIEAFQRNEGSGSQSMLIRFMGDTPIMEPETEEVVGGMGGIIHQVVDYQSKSGSIGFSFRYYVESIIAHPEIKMIAVEGVAPTVDNIRNGTYPIVTPVYAVTYENNPNPNVKRLVDWILSEEGQYIIEKTGYVGIGKTESGKTGDS